MNRSERIAAQLGMPQGTAQNRLRKNILFSYVQKCGDNFCYKCGAEIEFVDDLSIEHKEPWEGRDPEFFWDLGNVTFSHLSCNKPHRVSNGHLSRYGANSTLRCSNCKEYLPEEDFALCSRGTYGRRSECKKCNSDLRREYRDRTGRR